ncbi:MAG: phosphoenolpyruvate--protein phosphotransferase [Clostridia bacterium]|nr:phosphoenolpyruvate--protein phosphotransferase [Clostridia bacterium]
MIIINGLGVSEGIAMGKLSLRNINRPNISKMYIEDIDAEIERYFAAKNQAYKKLDEMYESALKHCGEREAELFEVHKMMIEDDDYQESILSLIKSEHHNAEYAVKATSGKFFDMFLNMDDDYMKSRAEDVRAISRMLVDSLIGGDIDGMKDIEPGSIVFAEDISPGEISKFKQRGAAGLIASAGSKNSHASILARVMGIPTIVGIGDGIKEEFCGKHVILDGSSGEIYIEPDEKTHKNFIIKIETTKNQNMQLQKYKGKESITSGGKKIDVYANMNNPSELSEILMSDAEGIGLFRTEFLYLGRDSYPSEEEQFQIYKNLGMNMNGKKVIVRTLDIGSDKQEKYMNFPKEENPALGYRGIRVCLNNPEIFKTQLRAIYRASEYGNFSIMFPMIISVDEIREVKKLVLDVKQELSEKGIKFNENVPLGVMIETPAAAILSSDLADEVQFFSIGTNDLTQYTLALDRQNSMVGNKFNSNSEAVIRFIEMIVKNAHAKNIPVGICGEMASDKDITEQLLNLGIDELSVSPKSVLAIRKNVISSNAK